MDITGIFNPQTLFCIMKYNITEKVKHVPDGISIPSKKLIFGLCIEKKNATHFLFLTYFSLNTDFIPANTWCWFDLMKQTYLNTNVLMLLISNAYVLLMLTVVPPT